jgi:hypothetical protein
VIAQSAFELPEWWLMQSGTNPAGLAPRVVSGLNAVNQARVAAGLPAPARIALSPERQRQLELYNLGQTYGVDLLPADVSGNTIRGGVLRGSTAGGAQTILGGPQIRSAAARANAQMGDVARQTAQAQGQVLPAVEAGEALQRGARTYVDTTSARADRLYKQAERAAGDLRIPAENAVNAVDTAIMQAMEGGKAATDPAIVALQNIRDRLTRFDDVGGLSFNGIRQVISDLGAEAFGSDMVANNLSRVLKNIRANAKQDLTAAVRRTGSRSAINKLNRANAFWENRVETINDVLEPILGAGKSGEDIVAAVQSMSRGTKGGSRRLSGLLAAMPADAANNARATIIDRLGMAAPSAQGAEGGVFSSATFLTNWNKMTPEGRNALIGNNPAVRQRLNDLARLAEARQGTERLSNVSGTGRAVNFATQLGQAAALVGGSFYDMGTALTLAALDAGAGRLLSSPEFARIVAGAPKSGQAAMSAAARARVMKQLGALAARQPGFQPYINKIADSLSNPTPPPFDYTKVGEPAPEMPDFSNLSADDLATLRASMVPKDAVEDADVALPPEPSMNVTAPVE